MRERIILDCTLRDGGYYNNWDFAESTVVDYIHAMHKSEIDAVEIGFRQFPKAGFLGPYAYSRETFLKTLTLPSNISFGVMVNAIDLLGFSGSVDSAIDELFVEAESSVLDFVRVASHFHELEGAEYAIRKLKKLGYTAILNLMQVANKSISELEDIVAEISGWSELDVLYVADSFGSLSPNQVSEIVKAIKRHWKKPIGFHAHNNKGQAVINSLTANACGAVYIDSTVLGMGRGAGNTATELLLLELIEEGETKYFPQEIYPIVVDDFASLKRKYEWGPNLFYYLAAIHDIHPMKVQEVLSNPGYDSTHKLALFSQLEDENSQRSDTEISSNDNLNQLCLPWEGVEQIFLIGSGNTVRQHAKGIIDFIENTEILVLCVNTNNDIPSHLIDAYVTNSRSRLIMSADYIANARKHLVFPEDLKFIGMGEKFEHLPVVQYPCLSSVENDFQISELKCTVPYFIPAAYALSVATALNPNRILLAGFDGYQNSDPRQLRMQKLFEKYNTVPNKVSLLSVTPTSYLIEQGSIYSL